MSEAEGSKEQVQQGRLQSLIAAFTEAQWLLVLSVFAYLFAFFFVRSYLSYFGVDSLFVEVSTQKLLISGTGFLATFTLVWQTIGVIQASFLLKFFALIAISIGEIILGLLAIGEFYAFGYSWWFFGLLLGFLLVLSLSAYNAVTVMRKGGTFSDYLFQQISNDVSFEDKTLRGKVFLTFGDKAFAIVLLAFLVPALGSLTGQNFASNKKSFHSVLNNGKSYLLVEEYEGSFIAVGIKYRADESKDFELNGEVWVAPISELGNFNLALVSGKARKPVSVRKTHRATFKEFLHENFGIGDPTESNIPPQP